MQNSHSVVVVRASRLFAICLLVLAVSVPLALAAAGCGPKETAAGSGGGRGAGTKADPEEIIVDGYRVILA